MTARSPHSAWAGLTRERIDQLAEGTRRSTAKVAALRLAGAVTEGERREMLDQLEHMVARDLLANGCPTCEVASWIRQIASRAVALNLGDAEPQGHA